MFGPQFPDLYKSLQCYLLLRVFVRIRLDDLCKVHSTFLVHIKCSIVSNNNDLLRNQV